jgi:hypothetical protein
VIRRKDIDTVRAGQGEMEVPDLRVGENDGDEG